MSSLRSHSGRAAALALAIGVSMAPLANAQEHRQNGQQDHNGQQEHRQNGQQEQSGQQEHSQNGQQERSREPGAHMPRQPAPHGYRRPEPPRAVEHRPEMLDQRVHNREYQAHRQYRVGRYHEPEGFRYQRYRHGEMLPPAFWIPDYRLTDFWLFGLEIPPIGYEWVRFGPDALLVNIHTRQVVNVVYDIFL